MVEDLVTDPEYSEYIYVINLRSVGTTITLTGNLPEKDVPYKRAIIYRFLIFNEYNYDLAWSSNVDNFSFIWNTYSETPPALDANGTYIEFVSTDNGKTWFGTTSARTAYDIVNNYYTKSESDARFINADGDTVTGGLMFTLGNSGPYNQEDPDTGENVEIIYNQLQGKMADDDQWRIATGATSNDRGFLEIATGDDASEPIYVSQYNQDGFKQLVRRASLLDSDGNTSFPGTIYAQSIKTVEISTSITPDTDDRSNNVATTEYVRNYIDANINHWLVPQMDDTTSGMYLTNDGDKSYWIDLNKSTFIHYAVSDLTELDVPLEYLENAIVADVYRDGVLLTDPDDYTFNLTSGKILFKDTINTGEKIIVVIEKTVKSHTNKTFEGVTIKDSFATTPDVTDNSSKIATTAYVNNILSNYTPSGGGESIPTHSPAFTGKPTAPTADTGTNTTQIATTEFVNNSIVAANHAPIDSPSFTGTPTAPNPLAGDRSTQISTTKFVTDAIDSVVDNAPTNLNTLRELANAINNNPSFYNTVNSSLSNKLNVGIAITGTGNALTAIYESNGNISVEKGSTFSLATHNHDSNYTALKQNIGSETIPIYTNDSGVLTASTATIGDSDTPVYFNSGSITSTGKHFSDYLPLSGGTVTGQLIIDTSDLPSLSVGNIDGEHLEINPNNIQSKFDQDAVSDLYINSNGGSVHFGNITNGEVVIKNGVITANELVGTFSGSVESASKDSEGNVINETYATIDSPSFGGIPTAPTAAPGDNSNQIATTSYVDLAISNLVNTAPDTLNTLNELADALGNDANFAANVTNSLNNKLDANTANYIKSVTINDHTLSVVSGDNVETQLQIPGTEYNAGEGIIIENGTISAEKQLPNQTNNSGKFLSTNGTDASWEEIYPPLKLSSVHYPQVNDTSITLTEEQNIPSGVNKFTLAIYRNGVYLNNEIDYTFDQDTGVITFKDAFEDDEIVTVIFSYIGTEAQDSYTYAVTGQGNAITNATSVDGRLILNKGTVFVTANSTQSINGAKTFNGTVRIPTVETEDNSTRAASTEYVNNRFSSPIENVQVLTSESNSVTIDPNLSSIFTLSLNEDSTISIGEITRNYYSINGATISLFMPANNYVISWGSNIHWLEGAPDFSENYNIITFITPDNGVTWYGNSLEVVS